MGKVKFCTHAVHASWCACATNMWMTYDTRALNSHEQWWFYRGAGAGAPPNLLCPTSWYYAWTIQNFINALIFRVRPRACYDDEEAEDLTSWVSSDCTRTHLRGPRIKNKNSGLWCPQTPLSGARISTLLLTLIHATLSPPIIVS